MKKSVMLFYKVKLVAIIVVCFTISSCHGQVEPRSKIQSNHPAPLSTAKTEEYKDPLFFVDGQLCQHLRKIYQDSKGNLWFGTNVYDLMMYNGDTLTYLTEKEGFSGGRVTGISEDSTGTLWFATGSGLNKYDGNTFTVFTKENGLSNSEIWSLLIDSQGTIWVGHNEGLSRFDGKDFENVVIPKPEVKAPNTIYSDHRIVSIVEDHQGNLWLGTDGYGMIKYDGKNFESYTMDDGLCDNTISELMVDSKGNIWIGTYWGGVSKYDGKKFMNYTKEGIISGVEVAGFFEDKNGDIWFGIENNGVYKYDGQAFSHYNKEDGLDAGVLSIFRDQESRFWFGGWGGLFRYDGKSFTSVTKDGPWE